MDKTQMDAMRARLEEEKAALERELAEYGADAHGGCSPVAVDEGFADSGQVAAQQSQSMTMIDQLRRTHEDVDAALARIEEGNYGICEGCGREIPIERLEARPTARLCVTCKQEVGG